MIIHRPSRSDRGFTLIEILIVMSVLGIVIGALATVFSVIARTTPTTEVRIDDARSTRGLQTWLSHDTTSAPPYRTETDHPEGWIDVGTSNRCGASGDQIVEFRWREVGIDERHYVASYRFDVDGDTGRIVRVTCTAPSYGGSYTVESTLGLTAGLDSGSPPTVTLNPTSGDDVTSVIFNLTAKSGEVVKIETGSRNPVEFYP